MMATMGSSSQEEGIKRTEVVFEKGGIVLTTLHNIGKMNMHLERKLRIEKYCFAYIPKDN